MIDPSVKQDLYQEYKYDLCYGAIESSMSFEQWLELYNKEKTC